GRSNDRGARDRDRDRAGGADGGRTRDAGGDGRDSQRSGAPPVMAAGVTITIDESGLIPLLKGLGKVEQDLRDRSNGRLRDAAGTASTQLVRDLQAAAGRAATPQARLVAGSIRVRRDRLVS